MDELPVMGCILNKRRRTTDIQDFCKDNCATCGWNQKVAAERKRALRRKYGVVTRQEIRCPFCKGRIAI